MDECVGDSVSKHNYNFISLDTTICNLSSQFFNIQYNYFTYFKDLCANINNFNAFADVFYQPSRINKSSSATRTLSSYWNKLEMNFTYPVNVYELNPYKQVKSYFDPFTTDLSIQQYGLNFLNRNYPASNFIPTTKANVTFLIYSNTGALSTVKTQNFGTTNRVFNIYNRKADMNIASVKTARYIVNGSFQWIYYETVV